MKRVVLAAIAAAMVGLLAIALTPDSTAAAKSPFVGNWTATDNDHSNLRLAIHGGPHPTSVKISDDGSSSCGGGAATGIGKATLVDADTFVVVFRVRCHDDSSKTEVSRTFEYRSDDTLRDNSGVVWTRG